MNTSAWVAKVFYAFVKKKIWPLYLKSRTIMKSFHEIWHFLRGVVPLSFIDANILLAPYTLTTLLGTFIIIQELIITVNFSFLLPILFNIVFNCEIGLVICRSNLQRKSFASGASTCWRAVVLGVDFLALPVFLLTKNYHNIILKNYKNLMLITQYDFAIFAIFQITLWRNVTLCTNSAESWLKMFKYVIFISAVIHLICDSQGLVSKQGK
jgi:hypothetical protein